MYQGLGTLNQATAAELLGALAKCMQLSDSPDCEQTGARDDEILCYSCNLSTATFRRTQRSGSQTEQQTHVDDRGFHGLKYL